MADTVSLFQDILSWDDDLKSRLLDALLAERGYDLETLVNAYTLQQIRAGNFTHVPRQQGEGE